MKRLHQQLVERWGDADDIFDFREGLHVANWHAGEDEEDVTSFFTLGMSERRMKGADYLSELTLAVRGAISAKDRRNLAGFLADVAEYPWDWDRKLDVWERLVNPGTIPLFPDCPHLLLAPSFGEVPFNRFAAPDDDVKILYVIPITAKEGHLLKEHSRDAFLDHLEEHAIDLFSPRADPVTH
jgi:hypothetical protein